MVIGTTESTESTLKAACRVNGATNEQLWLQTTLACSVDRRLPIAVMGSEISGDPDTSKNKLEPSATLVPDELAPRAAALATLNAPSWTVTGPVKVFAAASVSVPAPDLTRDAS
jgi:hypothetical protein